MKEDLKPLGPFPAILQDPVTAGLAEAIREATGIEDVEVSPFLDPATGFVKWQLTGNVKALMEKIHDNFPVGALDVLSAVRKAKDTIYAFRTQGRRQ